MTSLLPPSLLLRSTRVAVNIAAFLCFTLDGVCAAVSDIPLTFFWLIAAAGFLTLRYTVLRTRTA